MAKKETIQVMLPEGRVINESLFEMDVYTDEKTEKEGTPKYKVELAFDPKDVTGEGTVEDDLIEAACLEWGDPAEQEFLDGKIKSPFLVGDKLAARREAKGKEGDAYKGKLVVRADTIFNLNGQKGAPGGIQVLDENVKPIGMLQRAAIYSGMFGQALVTISCYTKTNDDGDEVKAMKFYLTAFQKTKDGDKLGGSSDHSSAFKPVGKPVQAAGAEPTKSRRSR